MIFNYQIQIQKLDVRKKVKIFNWLTTEFGQYYSELWNQGTWSTYYSNDDFVNGIMNYRFVKRSDAFHFWIVWS